jgi:hypothetical protein
MTLFKQFKIIKNIRRKGLSKLVFIAFAAMMIFVTILAVFQ